MAKSKADIIDIIYKYLKEHQQFNQSIFRDIRINKADGHTEYNLQMPRRTLPPLTISNNILHSTTDKNIPYPTLLYVYHPTLLCVYQHK